MRSLETEGPDGEGDSGSGRVKTSCSTATDLDLPGVREILFLFGPLVPKMVSSGGRSSPVLEGHGSCEEPVTVVPTEPSLEPVEPSASRLSSHA